MKSWFTYTLCCPYSSVLVCNVLSSSPQQFNPIYSIASLNYASSFKKTHPAIHTLLHQTHNVSGRKQQTDKTSNKSRKFTWCGVYIFFIGTIYLFLNSFSSDWINDKYWICTAATHRRCGTSNPMTQNDTHSAVDMRTWWSLFTGACDKVTILDWCG